MRESKIEKYFVDRIVEHGGYTRKIKFIGVNGCPDRLASVYGWQGLVEMKQEGKKPRKNQDIRIAELKAAGFKVAVIDSFEKVDALISREKYRAAAQNK